MCIICSHTTTMSDNFEVDGGKNSNESSTNVGAVVSCEKCSQTLKSKQELEEHSTTAH
jgi:hypothetical protein